MRRIGGCRVARVLPVGVLWVCALGTACAQVHFDLPAQPLADALRALGSLTHTNILFDPPLVAGRQAPALKADLSTEQALTALLAGQALRFQFINPSTVVLERRPASTLAASAPPPQPALAQPPAGPVPVPREAAPVAPLTPSVSEVVITGSRVIRPGMSSPTPVTAVSPIELFAAQPQSLAQGLAQLPSLSTSTVPASVGGRTTLGPGTFLNLRGLGSTRNLVLLDGRRVAPTNIAGNTDINLLPQALVSSVQIVTGGASAAYGSDAVAGVTNFLLDTRYTGFKADFSGGTSGHEDGAAYKLSLAWGAPLLDGQMHVVASFDWRHSSPAYADHRDWTSQHCAVIPIPGVTNATQSPSNPRQTLACNVTQPNAAYGGAITQGPLVTDAQGITFGPGGVPMPLVYGTLKTTNDQVGGMGSYLGDVVNFITPLDNKVLFTHASYDLGDHAEAYAQLTLSRTQTNYAQTPPYFNGNTAFTIFSGNPFIPAQLQASMSTLGVSSFQLGITPKSWGIIGTTAREDAYDGVVGVRGLLAARFDWDVHYEHGRTRLDEDYTNQISLERLYRAIDAVTAPDGSIRCASALANPAAYGDCVPLNPFGVGSASTQALAYIHGVGREANDMIQDDLAMGINGEPVTLWAGPLSLGAGLEWRRLAGEQSSDPTSQSLIDFAGVRGVPSTWLTQTGGWATTNVQPVQGAYDVTEGFAEALLPLVRKRPLMRSLDLNAAGRLTHYSQSGKVETWKLGLTWHPIDELLLRATRSRDIRAPGIGDLYSPNSLTPNVVVIDRLRSNQSVSLPTALAGNPSLVPETARTFTGGFTYQPAWAQGLGLSADYYDIRISDVLATVSAQDTIDRCALGEQDFCQQLTRNAAGTLTLVRLPTLNLSQARTRGVDLDASYRTGIEGGRLSLRVIGTRLLEQSTRTPTSTGMRYSDRVGDISLGAPGWLLNGLASYERGALGVDLTARFVGAGVYNATYIPGDLDPRYWRIRSSLTLNGGVRWRLESLPGRPEIYFNVQNLLDQDPPLVPGNSLIGFQTNSTLYDTMGRYFMAGMRVAL